MLWLILAIVALAAVVVHDLVQRRHAILRNFPVVGHFRYWIETIGPELRQYIVAGNDEERPFSRDQRRWVYASSKRENNYFGFGTDNDLEQTSPYLIVRHAAFPLSNPHVGEPGHDPEYRIPCVKVMGGHRGRRKAFRPLSIVNSSAMSFGSLSGAAIEAINRGAQIAGCLQNTGEGGVSRHHRPGGELVWQLGTGYFGARDASGRFDMQQLLATVAACPVRAIEIKLSQGAKPGLGGVLPGVKVTEEIASIRGVPIGRDCISPNSHSAFRNADEMLDFVERLAAETGLPVGIKSAVGEQAFWIELARLMETSGRGVDFITIDGGEGGTGAGPLVFVDHVALPFKIGFSQVYREFAARGLHETVVFIGAGKLGFPDTALLAMALGCDMINVAREAMLSVGCIQAQRCHTGHCPTGVATQNAWLMRGLDPTFKAARFANYVVMLRKEILQLSRACGVPHPALVPLDRFEILQPGFVATPAREVFGYRPEQRARSAGEIEAIEQLMPRQDSGAPS
jgi:glutamate synthase domain-containing protein 2